MTEKQAPTAKSIEDVFENSHSALGYIMHRVEQLKALNEILYRVLNPSEKMHCQIGDFENGRLTLVVDNANWATKLRYQTPDLIKRLKQHSRFAELQQIHCLVRPKYDIPKRVKEKSSLSPNTKKLLLETASYLSDTQLKEALMRLVKE